jgi:hypothetical protein
MMHKPNRIHQHASNVDCNTEYLRAAVGMNQAGITTAQQHTHIKLYGFLFFIVMRPTRQTCIPSAQLSSAESAWLS